MPDVDAAYDALLDAGATDRMSPRPSPEPGMRMAYVADPEGNLVELLDRTRRLVTGRLDGKIALITGVGGAWASRRLGGSPPRAPGSSAAT